MAHGRNDSPDPLAELRTRLLEIPSRRDRLGILAHVASIITDSFLALGMNPPIVVGGLAVETYTGAEYTTRDVDLIHANDSAVATVMHALGFTKQPGHRYYQHARVSAYVEFPTGPLDGDCDRVAQVQLDDGRCIYVIGIEDIILDRVAAYQYWDKRNPDSADAIQAVTMLVAQRDKIDRAYLENAAVEKGLADALAELQHRADILSPK